eukprot:COSAG05_NODE_65_length_22456_cov_17.448540_10_plen_66_part_00
MGIVLFVSRRNNGRNGESFLNFEFMCKVELQSVTVGQSMSFDRSVIRACDVRDFNEYCDLLVAVA